MVIADYLVTVEPNSVSGHSIISARISGKSEEYKDGFVAALELEYSDQNKYRINCTKI